MANGNQKGVFITIIVLLCVFLPGTILGIVGKSMDKGVEESTEKNENENKEFLFNNKLHFYSYGELLGTYSCKEGYLHCDYAYEYIDDNNYHLNYYDDGKIDKLGIINDKYVFISDGKQGDEYYRNDGVILYDIENQRNLVTYQGVKNYTIGIENDLYIVKNNNKWGIIKITGGMATTLLEPSYDYIGLQNTQENNLIVSDQFAVMNNNAWGIIDVTGARLSATFNNQIVAYNGSNIITLNNGSKYELYSYQGDRLLNSGVYNRLEFIGKYIGIYDMNNMFYIYDYVNNKEVSSKHAYGSVDDIQIEYQDSNALIKKGGQVLETVSLV